MTPEPSHIPIPQATHDEALPTRQELIEICLKIMELRESGDWAQLATYLTDDFEMDIPGLPLASTFSGSFKGRAECIDAIRRNFTLIEPANLTARRFIHDGDRMVIPWTCAIRNRGTGPMHEIHGVMRLRFRGRLACSYSNHFDTAAVAALIDPRPIDD